MRVIWTKQDVEKLEEFADYIVLDNPTAALRWVEKIEKAVANLRQFPKLGREVPEAKRPEIREIIMGEYRIICRLEKRLISILTIYHSKQLLKKSDIFEA